MVKCTECKMFAGMAIFYNGRHYLECKIEGLVPEDAALEEELDCEFYVENLDVDCEKKS